jgi:hypothetical protein
LPEEVLLGRLVRARDRNRSPSVTSAVRPPLCPVGWLTLLPTTVPIAEANQTPATFSSQAATNAAAITTVSPGVKEPRMAFSETVNPNTMK